MAMNSEIINGALGRGNDFFLDPNGKMANYNITSSLHTIVVPTFLTEGYYDIVRQVVVDTLEQHIPTTERITLTESDHLSMLDEPGLMNDAIADFFDRVEQSLSLKHYLCTQWKSTACVKRRPGTLYFQMDRCHRDQSNRWGDMHLHRKASTCVETRI